MEKYIEISCDKAYRLLNTGAVGITCTRGKNGIYNLAPMAWITPIEYDPVTRVLVVSDKENKTSANILETHEFGIAIPHVSQIEMVKHLGSNSGNEIDKISHFHIPTISSKNIDVKFPAGCIGYLECKLYRGIDDEGVMLLIGEVLYATALSGAFDRRLLSEKPEGKVIHHLGGKLFYTPSDQIH